jgi:hypothetical protein
MAVAIWDCWGALVFICCCYLLVVAVVVVELVVVNAAVAAGVLGTGRVDGSAGLQ